MEKIECGCGSFLLQKSVNAHFYTNRHQKFVHLGKRSLIMRTKEDRLEYAREKNNIRNPLKQDTELKWCGR